MKLTPQQSIASIEYQNAYNLFMNNQAGLATEVEDAIRDPFIKHVIEDLSYENELLRMKLNNWKESWLAENAIVQEYAELVQELKSQTWEEREAMQDYAIAKVEMKRAREKYIALREEK